MQTRTLHSIMFFKEVIRELRGLLHELVSISRIIYMRSDGKSPL